MRFLTAASVALGLTVAVMRVALAAPPDLGEWRPVPLEFKQIRQTGPNVVFDAYYRGLDLMDYVGFAKWYGGRDQDGGPDITPIPFGGLPDATRGTPSYAFSTTLEDGSRPPRSLYAHPSWEEEGKLRGYLPVFLPAGGGRLVATVGLNANSGSDGVTFVIGFLPNEPGATHQEVASIRAFPDGKLDTIVVDLYPLALHEGWLTFSTYAGPSSGQDWATWADLRLAYAPPVVLDLVETASQATWSSSAGPVTFGEEPGANGAAKLAGQQIMADGRAYGGPMLHTRPAGNEYFVEGTFPEVTIPEQGAVFRARAAYAKGGGDRTGFQIMPVFVDEEGAHVLTDWAKGAVDGTMAFLEADLKPLAGRTGRLVLYVNGLGIDNTKDDVFWLEARIYRR